MAEWTMAACQGQPEQRAAVCPRCGGPNGCALAAGATTAEPCWCAAVTIAPALLAGLPSDGHRRACLCPRCARGEPPATDRAVT